jgi:hypothetical protein
MPNLCHYRLYGGLRPHSQIAPLNWKDIRWRTDHRHESTREEVPGGRRWLPQTMNRCRYRLTAVSVSVLTLPS